MRHAISVLVGCALALGAARAAHAYPQFQLSRDQTCTDCHLSPGGGTLLSENGYVTSEAISQLGTSGDFMYGKLALPSWLALGGDMRGATGLVAVPEKALVKFLMQTDFYSQATFDHVAIRVDAGLRDPEYTYPTRFDATWFASPEHYVQYQQDPGSPDGLFVRAGRFTPVYGLRFAEHVFYDRRYGGMPLYNSAYGAAVEYIDPRFEVHATGFAHDFVFHDSEELGDGAALYAESRVTKTTSVGVESKLDITHDDRQIFAGATAKHYFEKANVLVEGELEYVHDKVLTGGGGTENGLVGIAMGSYYIGPLMIDLAAELLDPNVSIKYLDQEAFDLDVHYFLTSHVEVLLLNRLQMLDFGAGGNTSGWSLVQLHYRL